MNELFALFSVFFRIGALTFGGGYAMLPMLQKEVVERHGWTTSESVLDYYALSQCMPGVIAVNAAAFIGYKRRGVAGTIAAVLGVVTPSFIIILIVAALLTNFADNPYVIHAFNGIRVAVAALIVQAILSLWGKAVRDWVGILLFAAVFALSVFTDFSPIWFVVLSAMAGILLRRKAGNQ